MFLSCRPNGVFVVPEEASIFVIGHTLFVFWVTVGPHIGLKQQKHLK